LINIHRYLYRQVIKNLQYKAHEAGFVPERVLFWSSQSGPAFTMRIMGIKEKIAIV
jgi:hypothetical protein